MINAPKICLREPFDAAVLICHLLKKSGELPEDTLLRAVTDDETASYIVFSEAMALCENKALVRKDGGFAVTEEGEKIEAEFINSVPLSIREKALAECARITKLNELRKSIKWNVTDGNYFNVRLLGEPGKPDILQVKLYAPSAESARELESAFLENPVDKIGKILDAFIKNK